MHKTENFTLVMLIIVK